jgi:hypothetical protein
MGQFVEYGHHPSSSSTCDTLALITPKKHIIECCIVTTYHTLTQATIKYYYPLPQISSQFAIGFVHKQGGHQVTYHSETLSLAKFNYNNYAKYSTS